MDLLPHGNLKPEKRGFTPKGTLMKNKGKLRTWSRTPQTQPLGREDDHCLNQEAELDLEEIVYLQA